MDMVALDDGSYLAPGAIIHTTAIEQDHFF
jgi:hypothetical protein